MDFGFGTSNSGVILPSNSSSTPLSSLQQFTGIPVDVSMYPSVVFACLTDRDGVLYAEFSADGITWQSSLPYNVLANKNEVHRLTVTRRYFRLRFVNTSLSNQTSFSLQSMAGSFQSLTSALNTQIQRDADSLVVRSTDFNLLVAENIYENTQNTIKDGINFDIDTGTLPKDVTNEGGVYAGFPLGSPEAGEIVVEGADVGTVFYSYMASSDDLDYTFGSVAINGAGTYPLGHNVWRSNFAYFVSNNPLVFNTNTITCRNTVTTTNVFWQIQQGFSQTYCSAYTTPANSEVFFDRITGSVRGSTSGTMDGYFYYRPLGESPRLRFPFELQFGTLYFDDVDYLIRIPQKTDIVPRIQTASANNLIAKISYRIVKIKGF